MEWGRGLTAVDLRWAVDLRMQDEIGAEGSSWFETMGSPKDAVALLNVG